MKTIHISATKARKNFFEILEKAVQDNVSFIVNNRNLSKSVKISVSNKIDSAETNEVDLDRLAGSLQTKVPYRPDETSQAHQIYALKADKNKDNT